MIAQLSSGTSRSNDDSREPHDEVPKSSSETVSAAAQNRLLDRSFFTSMFVSRRRSSAQPAGREDRRKQLTQPFSKHYENSFETLQA